MKNSDTRIEFVSSANKLKNFLDKTPLSSDDASPPKNVLRQTYSENKKNGLLHCSQILEKTPAFHAWKPALEKKKADDLADCFLQGLWYLKKHNLV
jgi:hypothetical protein